MYNYVDIEALKYIIFKRNDRCLFCGLLVPVPNDNKLWQEAASIQEVILLIYYFNSTFIRVIKVKWIKYILH